MRISITLLQYDHGLIRQVVDVLGVVVKNRNADRHLEDVKEIVGFCERFMDRLHHRKEERFLFPTAVLSGTMKQEEMDALLVDHEHAHQHIMRMMTELRQGDLEAFYSTAHELVSMMQAHIRREEDEVFPRIEEGMDPETDSMVYKRFEDMIMKEFPPDFYQTTESFANRIQDDILGPGYFEHLR